MNFDHKYTECNFFFGIKPSKLLLKAIEIVNAGKALDLGSGEGKNAFFLAKNGFDVTAVDISEKGHEKLMKMNYAEKLKIEIIEEDAREFTFNKTYDLIINFNLLQFLRKEEVFELISKMKKNTSIGGINIIKSFTEENPNKTFNYLFEKDVLKNLYPDWEIVRYREFITPIERHGKGKPHVHGVVVLIAKKI